MQRHPEVRVIARDRDARYAEAISWAAPQAAVVLDRWHLLRNLVDAFERHLETRHAGLRAALKEHHRSHEGAEQPESSVGSLSPPTLPSTRLNPPSLWQQEQQRLRQERRQARFDRVHDLHHGGMPKSEIAREVGLSRSTIRTYLKRASPPDSARKQRIASVVDPFGEYLAHRWSEGCRNAAKLTREIRQQGYRGTRRAVQRYVRGWRLAQPEPVWGAPLVKRLELPAPRALVWALLTSPEQQPTGDRVAVEVLLASLPGFAAEAALMRRGYEAFRHRDLDAWQAWAREAQASPCRSLKRFLMGLAKEWDGVRNAFLSGCSNGPTEGHVNRVKLIKRQMYGRAGFELLRKKILYRAA